jgi:hypothetical protein
LTILPLKNLLSAVLNQIRKASYLNGKEDFGLCFGSRNMESYAIEVGDGLVNGSRRGSRILSVI